MLEELKTQVCQANLELVTHGLVVDTWGNASAADREGGRVVIKPSGVAYESMAPQQMVVVSLETGDVVEGDLQPSSDTPTHLELYRAFEGIGGIVHTHSMSATAWAQAQRDLPMLGTTHADHFYGPVPCTRAMKPSEIQGRYEANTGKVIVERFEKLDPMRVRAVLVYGHGPFTWGIDAAEAVRNAVILEHLARMGAETVRVDPYPRPIQRELLDKHFFRKHGPAAYYGQKPESPAR